ncbi:MAG: hypothetical protein H0W78_05645 [Planctomycetes bacterium]|nr:hypothetical protein [Planctomycetota bacterium]
MPTFATEHDLQRARGRIDRCYLCGNPLNDGRPNNRDHAPPRALFLEADRTSPLILPTHEACNGARSERDEIVGQLVHILHRRHPDPERDRRGLEAIPDQQGHIHAVLPARHLFFSGEIDRWVRACHATLYGVVLPRRGVQRNIHPPMPTSTFADDGTVLFDPVLPQVAKFVEVIRRNRMANTLDAITAWNDRFRYECIWVQADTSPWLCMWAMRVYDWERLGETWPTERRGCTGFYWSPDGKPRGATVGTVLNLSVSSAEPLDPFATSA